MSKPPQMIQWNRVLKLIRDAENGSISAYDLAEVLKLSPGDASLDRTLTYLQRRGDISIVIGARKSGQIGRVCTITTEGKSRRELLGDSDEPTTNSWADKYSDSPTRKKKT
jgi:hypothetical protein